MWYSRIENSKHRCGIYLGEEENIHKFLSDLYDEDWSKDDFEGIRTELKGIISQYSRYKIFHSNWEEFDLETHNLKSIKEWCDKKEEFKRIIEFFNEKIEKIEFHFGEILEQLTTLIKEQILFLELKEKTK